MPNFWRFNQTLFNWWRSDLLWTTDKVLFNWFWLLNEHYITTKLNVRNMPSINLIETSNPKSDWATLLDRYYKQRTITIEWHILWESMEDEQNKIDNLKKALNVKQWYFEFLFWDTYRRILCTLTNQDIISRESYDIEHAQFRLTFKAEMPFRKEKSYDSNEFKNISWTTTQSIYNWWSVYSEPKITINVNSASNMNELSVWIWDDELSLSWITEIEVSWATFWWETVVLTEWADNTRSWVRPSTLTQIVISLNWSIPSCIIWWTQEVPLTEQSETQRFWTTQQWTIITITLSITRTETIEAWDEIIIDCEEKVVSLNWVSTDFSWKFPKLQSWTNIIKFDWNWTFDFDVSVLFSKNYL